MRQADGFVKLIAKRRDEEHVSQILAARMAQTTDSKALQKYLKTLEP